MLSFELKPNSSQNKIGEWKTVTFFVIMSYCLIFMGFTTALAPVPLTFVFLMKKRNIGLMIGAIGLVVVIILEIIFKFPPLMSVLFLFSFISASLIAEIIYRKLSPDRGLVMAGVAFGALLIIGLGLFKVLDSENIKQEMVKIVAPQIKEFNKNNPNVFKQKGKEARFYQDLLKNPKEFVEFALSKAPRWFFNTFLLSFWISFLIILRSSMIWKQRIEYPFTLRHLISFRTPEFFVWPLIFVLALVVGGEYLWGPSVKMVGENLLYILGIFYVFQGFGVYYDVLQLVGIRGFFRALLVVLAILMAHEMLAIVGIFDLWVNFRELIKKMKRKNKGDNL